MIIVLFFVIHRNWKLASIQLSGNMTVPNLHEDIISKMMNATVYVYNETIYNSTDLELLLKVFNSTEKIPVARHVETDRTLGLLYRLESLYTGSNDSSFHTYSIVFGNGTQVSFNGYDRSYATTLYTTILLGLFVVIALICVLTRFICLAPRHTYTKLFARDRVAACDDMKRPLHLGVLDDEYGNTFVGLSMPVLQETSKV